MLNILNAKLIVIKIGSSLLFDEDTNKLNFDWLVSLAEDVKYLKSLNKDVIIVSSGAIALGAKATCIGRAFLYGLGAGGEPGVTKALEILHKELDMTMALCGHRDIRNVSRAILKNCPF